MVKVNIKVKVKDMAQVNIEVLVDKKDQVKVKLKFTVKVMVMIFGTQIRFPENLVKIRQAWASELVILRVGGGWVVIKILVNFLI